MFNPGTDFKSAYSFFVNNDWTVYCTENVIYFGKVKGLQFLAQKPQGVEWDFLLCAYFMGSIYILLL